MRRRGAGSRRYGSCRLSQALEKPQPVPGTRVGKKKEEKQWGRSEKLRHLRIPREKQAQGPEETAIQLLLLFFQFFQLLVLVLLLLLFLQRWPKKAGETQGQEEKEEEEKEEEAEEKRQGEDRGAAS